MRHLRALLCVSLAFMLTASLLTGCKNDIKTTVTPFTEMTWESTVDDVIAAEGDNYTTSDSVYKGITYSFPAEYADLNGSLAYMFDNNKELMSIAFSYSSDTAENLQTAYDKLCKQIEEVHGKSSNDTKNPTTYGDVWYRDEGSIVLSAATTNTIHWLQYAYMNPQVSSKGAKN